MFLQFYYNSLSLQILLNCEIGIANRNITFLCTVVDKKSNFDMWRDRGNFFFWGRRTAQWISPPPPRYKAEGKKAAVTFIRHFSMTAGRNWEMQEQFSGSSFNKGRTKDCLSFQSLEWDISWRLISLRCTGCCSHGFCSGCSSGWVEAGEGGGKPCCLNSCCSPVLIIHLLQFFY